MRHRGKHRPLKTDEFYLSAQLSKEIDRLTFLKKTASCLGGLGALSLPLACHPGNTRKPFPHLSQTQTEVINAFAAGLLQLPEKKVQAWQIDRNLDYIISILPPSLASQAGLALYVMEYSPLLFFRGFKRFSQLSIKEREKLVHEMMLSGSPFRGSLVHLLKSLSIFSLYQHPEFIQQTGISALRRCK